MLECWTVVENKKTYIYIYMYIYVSILYSSLSHQSTGMEDSQNQVHLKIILVLYLPIKMCMYVKIEVLSAHIYVFVERHPQKALHCKELYICTYL